MSDGEKTAHIARRLGQTLPEIEVLFDHGKKDRDPPECLGQIVSWFGLQYGNNAILAFLDIAIVQHEKAVALIEIEESSASPKVMLGDVFATLLGDHVRFQGKRDLEVGNKTTLIVLVKADSKSKQKQIAGLAERIHTVKPALRTGNAAIGHIVLDTFTDLDDLEDKTEKRVNDALDRYNA